MTDALRAHTHLIRSTPKASNKLIKSIDHHSQYIVRNEEIPMAHRVHGLNIFQHKNAIISINFAHFVWPSLGQIGILELLVSGATFLSWCDGHCCLLINHNVLTAGQPKLLAKMKKKKNPSNQIKLWEDINRNNDAMYDQPTNCPLANRPPPPPSSSSLSDKTTLWQKFLGDSKPYLYTGATTTALEQNQHQLEAAATKSASN